MGRSNQPASQFENQKSKIENNQGFALVVILAFVVLLTVLVLAYFSYSSLQRQISNSSSNQATVDIFAQGAINTIVSDFREEIAAGSTTNIFNTTNKVYIPLASSNAVPVRVGTGANLPNLIKRSANGLAFYPGGSVRASTISSTNASQNGRSISPARWNQALLLPKADTNSVTDFTPANFTAPDWIYVNRGGGNPTSWSPALRWNSSAADTNVVVGRFAYTIYDQGGLLDVNVAGYPPGTTNAITSYKSPLSYADLTQIGLSTNTIAALVGWRNAASSQPSGAFPNYGFNAASQTNFYKIVTGTNTGGFMRTANTNMVGGETDRMFISRQHLLQFFDSLSAANVQSKAELQNALQYLATFTRGLEQPSYAPNPNRPKIVGSIDPPAVTSVNSYQGNNTYRGGENAINMVNTGGFLSARVQTAFTRADGTPAVVGEPLVKRKFALSNLAKVATSATAIQSNTDPIYARFGLYRSSASSPWIYNHGSSSIMTLAQVAALPAASAREPDFAELLKAAINVGSVGKAGPSGQGRNEQYVMDVSGDVQILQIMANLIDQQKTDNYPTRIQYSQSTSAGPLTRVISGVQDLPYFYRYNFFGFTTQVPSPLLSENDKVTVPSGTTTVQLRNTRVLGAATLSSGSAAYMIIPQVWNPHDANTPPAPDGGPTVFRITAETNAPGASASNAWGTSAAPNPHFDGVPNGYTLADPPSTMNSPIKYMSPANTFIQFTDGSNGKAFREPTILWRNNFPTGVTLAGTSRQEDPSLTGNTYFGLLVGETPVSWLWSTSGTTYISQTSNLQTGTTAPGAYPSVTENTTFRVDYQDPSGNWITYQEAYLETGLRDFPNYTLYVNRNEPSFSGNNKWANPFVAASGLASGAPFARNQGVIYDPRSTRFGSPTCGSYTDDDPTLNGNPTLDAVTMVGNSTPNGIQNLAVGSSNFVLMKTQRPTTARGLSWNYLTPCRGYNNTMGWFTSKATTANGFDHGGTDARNYDGMFSQNNPLVKVMDQNGTGAQSYYYEDADGIARRAMGGYVGVSGSPSGKLTNTATTVGLPMVTSGNAFTGGIVTPSAQSQSRAIILHRPFRSVAEMSYAFRGTPWKNIDFFTPESGDTALLDVFCVNEPPADALVAGKVNLNTRQVAVLKAIFAGAYRDEWARLASPPTSGTQPALSLNEASNLANLLVSITSNTTDVWRGPLGSVAEIVGRFVYPDPGSLSSTVKDVYQYTSPSNGTRYTYSGFSAALSDSTIWDATVSTATQNIQRFRESAIRPLADCGQTRIWNVMIDVVAQNGRFPQSAAGLDKFVVEGEKRYWVHLAIDRYTGKVVDKQLELVSE